MHVRIRGLHGGFAFEGRLLDQHFVEHDAQRVLVGTTVHFAAHGLFRAHVSRRADRHALLGDAGAAVLHPGDSEVGDHRRAGHRGRGHCRASGPGALHAVVMGVLQCSGDSPRCR